MQSHQFVQGTEKGSLRRSTTPHTWGALEAHTGNQINEDIKILACPKRTHSLGVNEEGKSGNWLTQVHLKNGHQNTVYYSYLCAGNQKISSKSGIWSCLAHRQKCTQTDTNLCNVLSVFKWRIELRKNIHGIHINDVIHNHELYYTHKSKESTCSHR